MKHRCPYLPIVVAGMASLAMVSSLMAQNLFWDANGTGAGGTETSPTNVGGAGTWALNTSLWYSYSTPGYQLWDNSGSATASFAVSAGTVTIATGTTINANALAIRTSGFSIAGADSTSILNMTGTTPTITITRTANPTNFTLGTNLMGSNGLTITTNTGGSNNTTLNLNGDNSGLSGGLAITPQANSITINLGSDTAFGAGTVTLSAPNTVNVRSTVDRNLGNNLTANSNITFGDGGSNNGGLTFGTWTRNGNATVTVNNTTTVTGVASTGGTVSKTGGGNLVVNGNYSHGGAMTLTGGGVIAVSGTYGQANSGMTISGGSQLGLNGALTASINTTNSVKWGAGSAGLFAYGANATWGNSANNLTVNFGGSGAQLTWNGNGTTGFVVNGQALLLGNAISNGTIDFQNAINLNGATQTVQVNKGDTNTGGGADAILSGVLSNGGLTKTGNGTLLISGVNTYAGTTTVSGGTLRLSNTGSIANSTSIIVGSGATLDVSQTTFTLGPAQRLGGSGTISGAMSVSGTLSPGNSPGTLSSDSQTWLDGGDYNFQILDATGSAGVGYDTIAITGSLNLNSLAAGGFDINLWTLSSIGPDVNGDALNFDSAANYSWILASTTGGISGFDPSKFDIFTTSNNGAAGFSNSHTGTFAVEESGNNLVLTYTAVPEPAVSLLLAVSLMMLSLRRSNYRSR